MPATPDIPGEPHGITGIPAPSLPDITIEHAAGIPEPEPAAPEGEPVFSAAFMFAYLPPLRPESSYGVPSAKPHTGRGFWIFPASRRATDALAQPCQYCAAPEGEPCQSYPPQDKERGFPPPYAMPDGLRYIAAVDEHPPHLLLTAPSYEEWQFGSYSAASNGQRRPIRIDCPQEPRRNSGDDMTCVHGVWITYHDPTLPPNELRIALYPHTPLDQTLPLPLPLPAPEADAEPAAASPQ